MTAGARTEPVFEEIAAGTFGAADLAVGVEDRLARRTAGLGDVEHARRRERLGAQNLHLVTGRDLACAGELRVLRTEQLLAEREGHDLAVTVDVLGEVE